MLLEENMSMMKRKLAKLVLTLTIAYAPWAAAVNIVIDNPADGSDVFDTLTVSGTSELAETVELLIDNNLARVANGTDQWDVVLEPGSMTPGPHVLTARAIDATGNDATASVTVNVIIQTSGRQAVTYASSVDGETMGMSVYVPRDLDSSQATGLVIFLHGGGGLGSISGDMQQELDARGWIGISPDGRAWGLADLGCTWNTSAAYVDSIDPNVGPGQQDILDAIDWAIANFPIDTDRIYLTGFSMGGRGTYMIGLKNPDLFAAIAPMGPAIDMYEVFVRRPNPPECKEGMTGGQPGDSMRVDTMYTVTSGRFLIENAYNLPVFHGHGLEDAVASNRPDNADFMHGWHITLDNSWDGCFIGDTDLCFGHTPTLDELHTRHPDGYDWAFMFTPVAHHTDSKWFQGTPVTNEDIGVEDPLQPGMLLGIYDFFDRRELVHSPDTVVYKSYTDADRKAYWVEIDISTPWEDLPGAIRATRNSAANSLAAELARIDTATFDLTLAGLAVADTTPLTLTIEPLVEGTYDGALQFNDPLTPNLVLNGDFSSLTAITVQQDGNVLSDAGVSLTPTEIRIEQLAANQRTTVLISASGSTPVNQAPLANAGSDQTVEENGTVSLSAAASVDPEGSALTFSWAQTAGVTVTLSDISIAAPSFVAPEVSADESLVFTVTVTDANGLSDTDSVTVLVTDANDGNIQPNSRGGGSTGPVTLIISLLGYFFLLIWRSRRLRTVLHSLAGRRHPYPLQHQAADPNHCNPTRI